MKNSHILGFSLIELIMVITIVGIVAAIGIPSLNEAVRAWVFTTGIQDNVVASEVVAANRISRDIRSLKNDSSVTTANASTFTFLDTNNNSVSYALTGGKLMRNSDILADNVNALSFTYYNDSGNSIATPLVGPNNTDIRLIKIDYSLLSGVDTMSFSFQVRPQNLRRLNEKFK